MSESSRVKCCLHWDVTYTELKLLTKNKMYSIKELLNKQGDSPVPGPQTLGKSVDMVHTKGHKNPEPNEPDLIEPET